MHTAEFWLQTYSAHHRHVVNRLIHTFSIPVIVISLTGLLWSLPVPAAFMDISPALNWGTTFLLAAVVYYFIMSIPLALGMLPFVLLVTGILGRLDSLTLPLWQVSLALFLGSCALQMLGHIIEGGRSHLLRDLQYLMIGPVWLLAALYRRLGIPY